MGIRVAAWARWCALAIAALGASDAAPAQAPTGNPLPADVERQVTPPVAYVLPGMARVRVRQNLAYTAAAAPEARMDIYLPQSRHHDGLRPAVLLVHGSTDVRLRPKDWGFFRS